METAPFDRLLALNRHLSALHAAGLPIELGKLPRDQTRSQKPNTKASAESDLAEELEQYAAQIAMQMSRGLTMEEVLSQQAEGDTPRDQSSSLGKPIPATYQAALTTFLRDGDYRAALNLLSPSGSAKPVIQYTVRRSLFVPLILGVLAYIGLLVLCWLVQPKFEGIYTQLNETPSQSIRLLGWLRDWSPVWGLLIPLLGAGLAWRLVSPRPNRHQRSRGVFRSVPGVRRFFDASRNYAFTNQLAELVKQQYPLAEAIPLAGEQAGHPELVDAALSAAGLTNQTAKPVSGQQVKRLPPLLGWSLKQSSDRLAQNLRFTADAYRRSSQRQANFWQTVAPTFVGLLIGGLIVLAYGLAVFSPFVRLMQDLSLFHY